MFTAREKIYCNGGPGSLLHSVQMENIFSDSKTFVDMKMICEPETVLRNWEELIARWNKLELIWAKLKFIRVNQQLHIWTNIYMINWKKI